MDKVINFFKKNIISLLGFLLFIPIFTKLLEKNLNIGYIAIGLGIVVLFIWFTQYTKEVVLFLVLYVPLESFVNKWLPQGWYEMARFSWEFFIIFAVMVVYYHRTRKNDQFYGGPLHSLILLFVGNALVSSVLNDIPLFWGLNYLRLMFRYAFLYYLIINSSIDEEYSKKVVKILMAVVVSQWVVAVLQRYVGGAIVQFFAPISKSVGTIMGKGVSGIYGTNTWVFGTLERYNILGYFLAFVMLLLTGFYVTRETKQRRLLTFILITLYILVITYSRTSWIGLYTGVLFILFIQKRRKILAYFTLVPLSLLVILVGLVNMQHFTGATKMSVAQRFAEMFTQKYIIGSYKTDRAGVMIQIPATVLAHKPLFGYGAGKLDYFYSHSLHKKIIDDDMMHPLIKRFIGDVGWVAILFETGLIGIILWVMICYCFIVLGLRLYRSASTNFSRGLGIGYASAVVAVIVENMFCFNFTYRPLGFYFWLFGGIVTKLYILEKKKSIPLVSHGI